MKLNIEKLKDKLNNISSEVSYDIEKKFHSELNRYYNIIAFNNLIHMYIDDDDGIKDDIERLACYGGIHFRIEDFAKMRATLDFIENNKQAIKTAMLESIEE